MERLTHTKRHDGNICGRKWQDFEKYKPEDSALCVVEYKEDIEILEYLNEESLNYEVRFFENRDRCINNWYDVKRWKYLHE